MPCRVAGLSVFPLVVCVPIGCSYADDGFAHADADAEASAEPPPFQRPDGTDGGIYAMMASKKRLIFWEFFLISLGSRHALRAHMGVHRTCGEPNDIESAAAQRLLYGSFAGLGDQQHIAGGGRRGHGAVR